MSRSTSRGFLAAQICAGVLSVGFAPLTLAADATAVPEGPSIGPDVAAVEISLAFRPKPDPQRVGYYGFGETATPAMIAGWDIDVRPDGQGLAPRERLGRRRRGALRGEMRRLPWHLW